MLVVQCLVEGVTTSGPEVSEGYLLILCLLTFRWSKNEGFFFYFKDYLNLHYEAFDF